MSHRTFALLAIPLAIAFVACIVYAVLSAQWLAVVPASLGLLVIDCGLALKSPAGE